MTLNEPARLTWAVYCMPAFTRLPPSTRSQPENLSIENRFDVVEDQALRVLVRKLADVGFVRTQDQLRDRLDRLRAPRFHVDERIAIFDARGRHGAREFALPVAMKFATPGSLLTSSEATSPRNWKNGVIIWPLSVTTVRRQSSSAGSARVIAGDGAQQTVGRLTAVSAVGAGAAVRRGLGDGVEFGLLPGQAGQVELVAEFAAQNRLRQHVRIVEHGMDDRNLRLIVRLARSRNSRSSGYRNSCGRRRRSGKAAKRLRQATPVWNGSNAPLNCWS